MNRSAKLLRRDAAAGIGRLPPPGPLASAMGHGRDGVHSRLLAVKHRAYKTAVWLKAPRRKRDKVYVFGASHVVKSASQCFALRHKLVKAGLADKSVLRIPPTVPPFRIGSVFKQPPRNPYHVSASTLETFGGSVMDEILKQWGFS